MLLGIFSSDRRDGFKEGKAERAQSAQTAAGRAGDPAGEGPAPRSQRAACSARSRRERARSWGTGGGKQGGHNAALRAAAGSFLISNVLSKLRSALVQRPPT